MNSGLTIKRDLTHKEQSTLAALQAHITAAGAKYQWGSTFTVFADGTSSNNGIYRLQYGKDNTVKTNSANLLKVGDNDDTFGGGGGFFTAAGGTLTQTFTIDLSLNSFRMQRIGGNNPFFNVGPATIEMGYGGIGYNNFNTGVLISSTNISFKGTIPIGEADYSADLTDNALPQKIYVDSNLGGNALDSTVISPGATQDNGILGWNQSNQEFEFATDITLGAGAAGAFRTIIATGTADDVGWGVSTKGEGAIFFEAPFSTSAGQLFVKFDVAETVLLETTESNFAIKPSDVPDNADGFSVIIEGGDGGATDRNGGNVLLKPGIEGGAGLRGSVMIQQVTKTITGTSYTILESDWGKILEFTNAGAIAVTLPNGLSDGFECALVRDTGAGLITVSATTTLKSSGTQITTADDWATVVHQGSNVWRAAGLN